MQIVIDMPEEEYMEIKRYYDNLPIYSTVEAELYYIAQGIPLPKGHGRLIDADDLDITTITTDDYSGNEVLDIVLKEDIDEAPTIIEADKAESEKV